MLHISLILLVYLKESLSRSSALTPIHTALFACMLGPLYYEIYTHFSNGFSMTTSIM